MIFAMLVQQAPSFQFSVASSSGLSVTFDGIPVVQGSSFQYYEPGWTKGYYSSTYNEQKVEQVDANTVKVTYSDQPNHLSGVFTYRREGNTLHVDQIFNWGGPNPVNIENNGLRLWAPALLKGKVSVNGTVQSFGAEPTSSQTSDQRQIGGDNSNYDFQAPWGSLKITPTSGKWNLFDARNYPEEWAQNASLFWYGGYAEVATKDHPAHTSFDLTITGQSSPAVAPTSLNLPMKKGSVVVPEDVRLPLIPTPKHVDMGNGTVELTGKYAFPGGLPMHFNDFKTELANRFEAPTGATPLQVDGGISNMGLAPSSFEIEIRDGRVSVLGQDEEGVRNGWRRLGLMVYSEGGKLLLPQVTIVDSPSLNWRGFHLFVGPKALDFQKKLAERVLLPMGFNKAVIQCERTAWACTPNVRGGITMSTEDLTKLFNFYRKEGIEPIPLVQSFGHMEWYFAKDQNLDIALNPQVPYAVDPTKPATVDRLTKLWDEVAKVTGAHTFHFGCDEVTMRGFTGTSDLMTQLWATQMKNLKAIADAHGAQMMIWGDMALAPSDAPDAQNGVDPETARARREAIPQGTLIGDWHYKNDPKVSTFDPVLKLWKSAGLNPIASTWARPDNIAGFTGAAVKEGAGSLQTTWAGYESAPSNVLDSFDQFSAFVLSGDYAWSGKQVPASQLGYNPSEVFRRLYFADPVPLKTVAGSRFGTSETNLNVGRYQFNLMNQGLQSLIDPAMVNLPKQVSIPCKVNAGKVVLALSQTYPASWGETVATVAIEQNGVTTSYPVKYGWNVSADAKAVCPLSPSNGSGAYAVLFKLPKSGMISKISVTETSAVSGLRIQGVSAY